MDLKDNLCLVCRKYPSIDSTGVCSTCYNKMKRMNIHDYQWHRENDCFEGIVTEEEIEQHIFREMKKEQEDWAHWYNRVDAIDVYIAILDNVSTEILINNPIDIGRSWHRHQVSFVKDVLLKVDKSFFIIRNLCKLKSLSMLLLNIGQIILQFKEQRISLIRFVFLILLLPL